MKIIADDGREFKNVQECNAYEADLALKKQKEEADRKAKEENESTLLQDINGCYNKFIELVNIYEEVYNKALFYRHNYLTNKKEIEPVSGNLSNLWFYDDKLSKLLKDIVNTK